MTNEKKKKEYIASITPAIEGFIVTVQEKPPFQSGNPMQAISSLFGSFQLGEEKGEIEKLQEQAISEATINGNPIEGTHIFTQYNEMLAFLKMLYEGED